MTRSELQRIYFDWMRQLVCDEKHSEGLSYDRLLRRLHDTEFYYIIGMDGNRYEDGIDLRYRFGDEEGYGQPMVASYLDDRPCSILEMMIALAIRCEEHIMDDPYIGDRMPQWFWEMIKSLGLESMNDSDYDEKFVDETLAIFLERKYEKNGKGGLFTVKTLRRDLRSVEIWYQMCWRLNDILNGKGE